MIAAFVAILIYGAETKASPTLLFVETNTAIKAGSCLDAEDTSISAEISKKKKKKKRRNPYMPVRLFEKGQWDARLSFGTVPTYFMDNAKMLMPPVQAGMDYRLTQHFSLGTAFGHSISESQPRIVNDGSQVSWTNNTTFLALRPGVHITTLENWDFYGGFSAGFHLVNIQPNSLLSNAEMLEMESHIGIKRHQSNFAFSGFTGFRRVVSHRWTVGGEIGSGISLFTVGASLKISKSKTDPEPLSKRKPTSNKCCDITRK